VATMEERSAVLAMYGLAQCWFADVKAEQYSDQTWNWVVWIDCTTGERRGPFDPPEAYRIAEALRVISENEDAAKVEQAADIARSHTRRG
jgi:hypothetical protein